MKTSPTLRLLIMGVILMALNVPLTMMCGIVDEREARRNEVAAAVQSGWGDAQTIGGPVLSVPYRWSWTDSTGRVQSTTATYHFLPEQLEIDGVVDPSTRKRSLFTIVVYTSRLKIRGRFAPPQMSSVRPAPDIILWEKATVSLGVGDPKGIARAVDVNWNGQPQRFEPEAGRMGILTSRIEAPAPGLTPERTSASTFEIELEIKGTRELRFIPAGNETTVHLTSSWPHPSFIGSAPDAPRIDAQGFEASWRVPNFARGFAPQWQGGDAQVDDELSRHALTSSFGVTLVQPIDIYVQTERAAKYAVLFIVMTFVVAFAWEIVGAALVHPIQYLFVGFTMCVFYLLLLSLAEHAGFDAAYILAATATILLLSWYWSWVLGARRRGAMMGAVMSVLYSYLYLLLRLEDYALLAGSIGLFLMLSILMFLTRRVNWFDLKLGQPVDATR